MTLNWIAWSSQAMTGGLGEENMNIGIDARFLGTETGIGRYVEELVKHLEQIAELRGQNISQNHAENSGEHIQFFIFLTEKNWDPPSLDFGVASNFRKVKANFRWYSWQEQVFFPFLIKRYKIDLMHFPHFNVPLFCPVPFVVTIHDLILLHHPSTRASRLGFVKFYLKYLFYRLVLKHAIVNSKAIFVPSEFTKKDILKNFKVLENKITITYEASSLVDVQPAEKKFLDTLKITKPYFLTVGNAYPHKNLERLFRVFKKFNSTPPSARGGSASGGNSPYSAKGGTGGEGGGKFQLVFIGPDDYFYCRLKRYAVDLGFERDEAVMPGRVTDSELKTLYLNAFAYIFPSLYEGFGLPGLEAMSCGAPIVAADCTSLPEVYGNAAFYFNPKSDDEMLEALVRITQDDKLRDRLRENGFKIIKQYNWLDLAQKTLNVYLRYASG